MDTLQSHFMPHIPLLNLLLLYLTSFVMIGTLSGQKLRGVCKGMNWQAESLVFADCRYTSRTSRLSTTTQANAFELDKDKDDEKYAHQFLYRQVPAHYRWDQEKKT
ncbi:hypothetical protein ACHAWF_014557 [Thalassiosira exigua]